MNNHRFYTIQQILLNLENLNMFYLDHKQNLLLAAVPDKEMFYQLFSISKCASLMQSHFQKQDTPVILMDHMGFAWICVKNNPDDISDSFFYCLLGPFFAVQTTELHLRQLLRELQISDTTASIMVRQFRHVPVISFAAAQKYTAMLYYGIYDHFISASDMPLVVEETQSRLEEEWHSSNWHGTWEFEQEMLHALKKGERYTQMQMGHGRVGTMSIDNPLRQEKNAIIVYIAICIRAAIEAGVSPEGAYTLSDHYIQEVEACKSISDVLNCSAEMYETLLARIQKVIKSRQYSSIVSTMQEYVTTHIYDKIVLKDLAKELGYTAYYLSKKFQTETGQSFNNYVKQEKIALAKQLLNAPGASISDISERLSFSSPSFFSAIFREYTGLAPKEYLKRKNHPDL